MQKICIVMYRCKTCLRNFFINCNTFRKLYTFFGNLF